MPSSSDGMHLSTLASIPVTPLTTTCPPGYAPRGSTWLVEANAAVMHITTMQRFRVESVAFAVKDGIYFAQRQREF